MPWERRISAGNPAPWLALLVVQPDEVELISGALSAVLPPAAVAAMDALDPLAGQDPQVTAVRVKAHFAGNWAPLSEWITEQKPDLVIHTGDVTIDGADSDTDLRHCAGLLGEMGAA